MVPRGLFQIEQGLRRLLYLSLALHVATLAGLALYTTTSWQKQKVFIADHARAVVEIQAQTGAMDATFKRCSTGLRWVERYRDQGKIVAVEQRVLDELTNQLEIEDEPGTDPPQR